MTEKEKEIVKQLKKELKWYIKAYNILMDHFDTIPDEDKVKVSKKLDKLGL